MWEPACDEGLQDLTITKHDIVSCHKMTTILTISQTCSARRIAKVWLSS